MLGFIRNITAFRPPVGAYRGGQLKSVATFPTGTSHRSAVRTTRGRIIYRHTYYFTPIQTGESTSSAWGQRSLPCVLYFNMACCCVYIIASCTYSVCFASMCNPQIIVIIRENNTIFFFYKIRAQLYACTRRVCFDDVNIFTWHMHIVGRICISDLPQRQNNNKIIIIPIPNSCKLLLTATYIYTHHLCLN